MFLKNWYKILGANLSRQSIATTDINGTSKSITWDSGTSSVEFAQLYTLLVTTNNATMAGSTTYQGVMFGSGNAAPTADDVCLSGTKVYNIGVTASVSGNPDETGVTTVAVYTITNKGSSTITIGEVALTAYNKGTYILIERTALDTPVTIPVGGVGQVNYTIRLNYPM